MVLTSMGNLSCSFSFPKGCTHQSMLLPKIAIQPSCSSLSHTVSHELCFMSTQLMSYNLALGFLLCNFSSSSRYVTPRSDRISDQDGPPFVFRTVVFNIKVLQQVILFQLLNNLDFQLPAGIAANKIKTIQAHQKCAMWRCFKGRHCFYLLCGATFPAKKDWKFFKTKFSPVMLSPIMCYQSLFTYCFASPQHCNTNIAKKPREDLPNFLINVEQKKKSLKCRL